MLCCVVWPPQTNEKWERTKLKVKAYVLKEIIMVNRRRPVKKLTNLLFCVSPRQDWDNSGLPAHDMQRGRCQWYETLIVAKQIGWKKVWAVWIAKEWWQEKMMHQKIHTHFFVERTLANSMERKNNCELLQMISDVTWWGYWRPNHCLHKNWKLSSWPSQSDLKWTRRGNRWVSWFFQNYESGKSEKSTQKRTCS